MSSRRAPDPLSRTRFRERLPRQEIVVKVPRVARWSRCYTYSDPTHWSRAVGRLTLNAQGEATSNVKWKVGGRVDGDLVYATSNFYLVPVKRNQRFSAIWGENYIDVSAGAWDFRVGAQQIIWGEVVGLFFADVVSAKDMREFLLPSFDVIRIPQWAARAEYFAGDSHVELIWIPVPAFDRIGKPGADFYPAPLPSPTPATRGACLDPIVPTQSRQSMTGCAPYPSLRWDLRVLLPKAPARTQVISAFVRTPGRRSYTSPGTTGSGGRSTVTRIRRISHAAEAVYASGTGYRVTE